MIWSLLIIERFGAVALLCGHDHTTFLQRERESETESGSESESERVPGVVFLKDLGVES